MSTIRVLVGDGQLLIADALALALAEDDGMEILSDRPTTGLEVLRAATRAKPDVVVLDSWMRGMNGAAAAACLRRRPGCPVVMLAWLFRADDVATALAAGVSGFLSKGSTVADIARAIERVHAGESPVLSHDLPNLIGADALAAALTVAPMAAAGWKGLDELTPREIEVIELISQGHPVTKMAEMLGVTIRTMRTHIESALKKTSARSQTEAVARARAAGIIAEVSPTRRPRRIRRSAPGPKIISVLVADAQPLCADAVERALSQEPDIEVMPDHPATVDDVSSTAARLRPDVAVLDYWIGPDTGSKMARAVTKEAPGCRVLLLSWCYSSEHINDALAAGAVGLLPKGISIAGLADAIRRIHRGDVPALTGEVSRLSRKLERRLHDSTEAGARFKALTRREVEILAALERGLSIKAVGRELGIKPGTVDSHLRAILKKSGTGSYREAVSLARYAGLLGS